MSKTACVVFVLAGLVTSPLLATPDATSLIQQLEKTFAPTELDSSGIKVTKAGAILTVQMDGVLANPRGKSGAYKNIFEDGQIRPDNCLKCQLSNRLGTQRAFQVGERVYLLAIELAKDSVYLEVQSCGACDPRAVDPTHRPFLSRVTFKFLKGALAATSVDQVQQVVEQVFKADGGSATAAAQQVPVRGAPTPVRAQAGNSAPPSQAGPAPADTPKSFEPIAPPPPPAEAPAQAPPRKLEMGLTIDQVDAMFPGTQPTSIPGPNKSVIHLYKDGNHTFKVTFTDGKVTAIDVN